MKYIRYRTYNTENNNMKVMDVFIFNNEIKFEYQKDVLFINYKVI